MFAGIVPPDHLYRLWDVLLYDGKLSLETYKSVTYRPQALSISSASL